jgi:cyclic pyranopterin phosphate synthase
MSSPGLQDRFGRSISYLRISVTDRCNYRCIYCMPEEGIKQQTHGAILTYEEITSIARVAAENGIKRIRLTGGEPLVRRGLPWLVRSLADLPNIEQVSMTTNASLLSQFAQPLAEAGLKRVNISLDTLNPEKFQKITRRGSLEQVWAGIMAAEAAGLIPIKINAVVVRGVNDDELLDLARLTLTHPWQVRFIELMPLEDQEAWKTVFSHVDSRYVPVQEIKKALDPLQLSPIDAIYSDGPAKIYQAKGAQGTIGFISPLSDHFCNTCNRLRLTADGRLRPCLLNDLEVSIREPLRAGEEILPYLLQAIDAKPEGHELCSNYVPLKRKMAQIGG